MRSVSATTTEKPCGLAAGLQEGIRLAIDHTGHRTPPTELGEMCA
jgi:hypothetical protein